MFPFVFLYFKTDPVFVGSAYIEESQPIGNPVGDDDKIYFFFSEAGKEFDFFDNTIVSRIARVCKVRHLYGWGEVIAQEGRANVKRRSGLELPLDNPRYNYLKTRRGAPMSKHVWPHLTERHAGADAMKMCHWCVKAPFLFDCANMFSTDLVSPCLNHPLLLTTPPSLPFLCNVISPSPSISLTMSAALVHPSSSLPFSASALSFAGVISIQGCFAAI